MIDSPCVKFYIGQLVHHKLFDYRGVIVDVDATFQGTDEWYDKMATTNPPKDAPWYHILVHDSDYGAYVSERNLEIDASGDPIKHPQIELFFIEFKNGGYVSTHLNN